jgi:hypothetical protein
MIEQLRNGMTVSSLARRLILITCPSACGATSFARAATTAAS